MQGSFEPRLSTIPEEEETTPKRMRLDSVSNVPWANLTPANDKETMERMRRHYEMTRAYDSLPEEKKALTSKVAPYPETPDRVFPGTPCYKITVEGRSRLVFVLDPDDGEYPKYWDGQCRPQSRPWWIVSHFIWRDPVRVEEAKKRYMKVYDRSVGRDPPRKEDFNSSDLPGGDEHDSYYVYGTPNSAEDAPEVTDPLFEMPFNPREELMPNDETEVDRPVRVRPWPYQQKEGRFPRQPPPVQQAPPPIEPAVPDGFDDAGNDSGSDGPPAGRGGRAARGAARGRRRAPPPPDRGSHNDPRPTPHISLREVLPPLVTGRAGKDWILADERNFEIGADVLKDTCEKAEELDYGFALRMQGLRGTNLSAVWMCTDPEYDLTDRASVLAQFVKMYMEKFYGQVSVSGAADVEEVVHEALRMHEEFCKGWITRHHKTLSAEITSASEALVGLFYDDLKPYFPIGVFVSRQQLSRFLRRHERYSAEFAHCLYHFMTSMEQSRGNRNPSYKAMSQEQAMYITAMKNMAGLLHNHLAELRELFSTLDERRLLFDYLFIDWHHVAARMPEHHKEFHGYTNTFNLYRSRTGARSNAFPPWQQMRN